MSRSRYSRRKPKPRTLSPKCLNRQASKLLLRCNLSLSPNHNGTNVTNKSNPCLGPNKVKHPLGRSPNRTSTNPTNKSKLCLGPNKRAGKSPPKQS
jgi:hypothetical protein